MVDPTDRRPPRPFEPPPWEQERFEELERRTAEKVEPPEEPEPAAERGTAEEEPPREPGPALDDKALEAMFVQLKAEEPAHDSALWKVGLVFSGIVAVIGSVLLVWGMAALARTGGSGAGMMGGAILIVFGGFFVGLGVWTAVRSLKERGVL